MIVVDSCVWIDFYRGVLTDQVALLRSILMRGDDVAIGDLILAEVLQGCPTERVFEKTRRELGRFSQIAIAGTDVAIAAAAYHRQLRALGVTPRKTIDTLIAARCIRDGLPLLTSDKDFAPFAEHLGLRLAA